MFLRLPRLYIIFLSLVFGVFLFFLFLDFTPSPGERFGVLVTDSGVSDRLVREQVMGAGFETVYSESATTVYLDDFGKWKEVALDQYRDKVETFDPRDDGYAEKLRSFFIKNEQRRLFFPLESAEWRWRLKTKMTSALGAIPFSVDILGSENPLLFWFILQCAAVLACLAVSRDKPRFALQLPVLLVFFRAGLAGTILSAVLAGLWELLREPFGELFSQNPYGTMKERFRPYQSVFHWIACSVCLYVFLLILLKVPPIPAAAGFFCFFLVEFLSYRGDSKIRLRRGLFIPVLIMPFCRKRPELSKSVALFAVAAFSGSLLSLIFPGLSLETTNAEPGDFSSPPSSVEYLEHMSFQESFSYESLGGQGGGYSRYYLGADGLIGGVKNPEPRVKMEIPPFPLERLTRFLLNYDNNLEADSLAFIREWLASVLLLILFVPQRKMAKRNGKEKNIFLIRNPRIAA